MSESIVGEEARQQGNLWSEASSDWVELQEWKVFPATRRAFDLVAVQPGERLLDVGCGGAGALIEQYERGVVISGVDAASGLIEVARNRMPAANFHVADMTSLPFEDGSFDVVTGFNSFQYPSRPLDALREARRVAAPGARLAVVVWGDVEQCEAATHFVSLRALTNPPPGAPAPLLIDQRIDGFIELAGFDVSDIAVVPCAWDFPDSASALRGMRSAGPVRRVISLVGDAAVDDALRENIARYTRDDGSVHYDNVFRVIVARAHS